MDLYKHTLFQFFICVYVTSIFNVVRTEDTPTSTDTQNSSINSEYDIDKAYEYAVAIESEYEWSISAYNLPERDYGGAPIKYGLMCSTYLRSRYSDKWMEYHMTDVVWKDKPATDVQFAKKISIPLSLRGEYSLIFKLREVSLYGDTVNYNFIGYVEADLKEITQSGQMNLPLKRENLENHNEGYLSIYSEKLVNNFDLISLELAGRELVTNSTSREPKSLKLFIQIYKRTKENEYIFVHAAKASKDSLNPEGPLNPEWPKITIPIKNLCNGDKERPLRFVCLDRNKSGADNIIGEFETTLNYITDHNRTFELKKGTGSGKIDITKLDVVQLPSFSEFIRRGLHLQCSIAIDFTDKNSHREITNSYKFAYEEALTAISGLIEHFDWDKKFLILGYGLWNDGNNRSSDSESKYDDLNFAECIGTQGIIDAYHKFLSTAKISGPSFLAPVVRRFAEAAKYSSSQDEYSILIVLTSGSISDLDETREALEEVSKLRAIVFIVGVGNKIFEDMQKFIANNEFGSEDHGDYVHFIEAEKFRAFDAQDVYLFVGRKLFLTRRDLLSVN